MGVPRMVWTDRGVFRTHGSSGWRVLQDGGYSRMQGPQDGVDGPGRFQDAWVSRMEGTPGWCGQGLGIPNVQDNHVFMIQHTSVSCLLPGSQPQDLRVTMRTGRGDGWWGLTAVVCLASTLGQLSSSRKQQSLDSSVCNTNSAFTSTNHFLCSSLHHGKHSVSRRVRLPGWRILHVGRDRDHFQRDRE